MDRNQLLVDDDRIFNKGRWSQDALEAMASDVMTVSELAEGMDIPYNSLTKAAREGRVKARQSGKVWLSTIADVKAAIEAGHLRPRKRLLRSI